MTFPDTCTYHHKKPPSYPPPPLPISHSCQPCPCTPSPPLSSSPPPTTNSPSSKSPQIHSTSTHSTFKRSLGGKILTNLYIYLFLVLLFFTQGVEAGGRGGFNLFSFDSLQNGSVFIQQVGGRGGGFFRGVTCDNSLNKTFVFSHTPEAKIQSGF